MATPHSGSRRHSRRSTGGSINFSTMSISPLTTTDLTEHHFTSSSRPKAPSRNRSYHHHQTRSSSYLQGVSAPPTPGILTPSTFAFTPLGSKSSITKSKSSTHLRKSSSKSSLSADEWLHRTGAALSADARESKGQSWLTTRDSSTSLKLSDSSSEDGGDDDDDAATQYYAASEHVHGAVTPMWAHTDDEGDPSHSNKRRSGEYEARNRSLARDADATVGGGGEGELGHNEDEDEDESEDDEEYTRRHTFVIGQFIDRWIGWSIFGAEDDTDDEAPDEEREERNKKKRQTVLPREPPDEEQLRTQRRKRDEVEDWQDPAWILSIATNLFF